MKTIDDAAAHAPRWRAGFGYEFLERPDGFPGLSKKYGLRFAEPPRVMDLTLTYRALASGQVDLIAGDATAGLIQRARSVPARGQPPLFPPYDAVPVARAATLLRYPEVHRALTALAGTISAADMQAMNHAADAGRRILRRLRGDFWTASTRVELETAKVIGLSPSEARPRCASIVGFAKLTLGSCV